MNITLPTKLKNEPIVEAIFELRFLSSMPSSNILPGLVFQKLTGNKTISRLPAAEIPLQLRDNDPNLNYAPLIQIEWEHFIIFFSDRSIGIAPKMPYPGWKLYKSTIIEVVDIFKSLDFIQTIQRYSLKYINILELKDIEKQISSVNIDIKIADLALSKENFQLRVEINENNFINAIHIISSAGVRLPTGDEKNGLIIDIDTIRNINDQNISVFIEGLSQILDDIHESSKKMFFNCITEETLNILEPIYEQ